MNQFFEAIASDSTNFVGACFKLVLSMLLGSIVGFERRRRGQTAGVRTFSLISMGSTMAMVLSVYVAEKYGTGDPTRMAAQVISGIGFLGAGTIIQMKGSVRGLTTAAGIWMVSTLGMAVGCGLYMIALVATGLILFILILLERIEHRVSMRSESRTIRIRVDVILDDIHKYRKVLHEYGVQLSNFFVEYDFEQHETRLNLVVILRENVDYVGLFHAFEELYPTKTITLANQINI
ncbi:MgtC/SapB family protein [uncultured Duncaniella sp.]|uniref:MgtC/SapB family protein n=1 Tax=uncultured Duncaniella sp. TaxID=2768039 RepID=UPI00265FBA45|nr:MgtC/SapB family protein [uncultured Duncaniella sp.]